MVTALAASGLPTARFYFAGFLPRKGEHRRRLLNELKRLTAIIVIYESPERLGATMEELRDEWGERRAVVSRELTKLHEEVIRTPLAQAAERSKRQFGGGARDGGSPKRPRRYKLYDRIADRVSVKAMNVVITVTALLLVAALIYGIATGNPQ